jgi:ubiquinone/menaquinone biosynthesis C-methylase UbiE
MPILDDSELTNEPVLAAESQESCDAAWEAAYLRFETAEQEIRKFQKRLKCLGADNWPADSRIAEFFCGRGNGLVALERLGFTSLHGADLSAALVAQYRGSAKCHVADCRKLPFADQSLDVAIVQGGLHHLSTLPDDLASVVSEVNRVLVHGGRFVVVEPWRTPFLDFVHFLCNNSLAKRASGRVEALATMIEHERETYDRWLDMPDMILQVLEEYFEPVQQETRWGKLYFVGISK